MTRSIRHTLLLLAAVAAPAGAQDPAPRLVVKTIPLRFLRPQDAARLASPYVVSPQGGVFEAGDTRAITIRETPQALARIDSLVREHDRAPTVLALRFQLIAALDAPERDPAIAGLDSTLRSLFRFAGYRLLAQGSTTAGAHESFSLTMAAADERFSVHGDVVDVHTADGSGSVRLRVALGRTSPGTHEGKPVPGEALMSTGLTAPLGQMIVLGSAAPSGGKVQALILSVRPEVALPATR